MHSSLQDSFFICIDEPVDVVGMSIESIVAIFFDEKKNNQKTDGNAECKAEDVDK
jgi:hypothetical protein